MTGQRIALCLQYDGGPFCGWQRQPQHRSVQQSLDEAIEALDPLPAGVAAKGSRTIAAGRTDTGVHAAAQVVHFDCHGPIPAPRWAPALNGRLPGSIRVRADRPLEEGRHSAGCRLHRLDGATRVEAVIDDTVVGSLVSPLTLPHVWQHGGTSLLLGRDRGLPVCDEYRPPFPWTGVLHSVTVESDLESLPGRELLRAALKSD